MTTALHAPVAAFPDFPTCPTWCGEIHQPGQEVDHLLDGRTIIGPRTHERIVWAGLIECGDSNPGDNTVITRVLFERIDFDGDTPGHDRLLLELASPRGWARINLSPARARELAAALVAAADLRERVA